MQIKVPDYDASPRQELFHTSVADETLYGGAAGGGKTAALVAEAVTICLEYPGIPVFIFRRTIPELKNTIIPEIHRQCAAYLNANHMQWNGQARKFLFDNKSTINLAYCDNDNDIYRYQGAEIPVLMVDELTQWPMAWYEYLKTRNRTNNPEWPVKIMACTNPGGVGHGWVKQQFIDAAPPETIITDKDNGLTRQFIPAKVDDHPNARFKEQYKKKLQGIKDQSLRRALLDGDWDVFAGQVFTEFRRIKHVVKPFTIPEHWPRWLGYDHGYNTRAAGLWFARDPQEDRVYIYRELYVSQHSPKQIAEKMHMYEQDEYIDMRLADPALWKGTGNQATGATVAEMFAEEGIEFVPANNDRIAGKNKWHEMLAPHKDGKPRILIFESCTNLIRTLPNLPYDDKKVEDVDTEAEDHLYDAGRYGLMGNPIKYKSDIDEEESSGDIGSLFY